MNLQVLHVKTLFWQLASSREHRTAPGSLLEEKTTLYHY